MGEGEVESPGVSDITTCHPPHHQAPTPPWSFGALVLINIILPPLLRRSHSSNFQRTVSSVLFMSSSAPLRGSSRANKSAVSQALNYRRTSNSILPLASPIPAARTQQSQAQQQPPQHPRSPAFRQCFHSQSPKMSMPASHGHSKPCCNIPPVVSSGYQPKGSYEEIGGFKTCMSLCVTK